MTKCHTRTYSSKLELKKAAALCLFQVYMSLVHTHEALLYLHDL
jgi:hypothetical protein